jgi:hypothetical protein
MKWIFGSFSRDALFLMVPGLIALAFARFDLFSESLPYILLVSAFADSGHIYTTAWRTWLHPAERQRSATSWAVPVGVALAFFAWAALKLPYMWTFVIYATIHHNLKQYYGVTRWYETINRHRLWWSGFFSKALMALPVIAYHFRATSVSGFYSEGDLFLSPNPTLLAITTGLYLVALTAWLGFEAYNFKQGHRETNRFLSIAFSTAIYGGAFFFGTTISEVLFPPVFGHGIGYMAMSALALQRTRKNYFGAFAKGFGVMIATAAVFGLTEHYVEGRFIEFIDYQRDLWHCAITGIYLIPLFSHFIYDMWLWKRTHWESRLVYDLTGKRADIAAIGPLATETPASASDSATGRAS